MPDFVVLTATANYIHCIVRRVIDFCEGCVGGIGSPSHGITTCQQGLFAIVSTGSGEAHNILSSGVDVLMPSPGMGEIYSNNMRPPYTQTRAPTTAIVVTCSQWGVVWNLILMCQLRRRLLLPSAFGILLTIPVVR